MRHLRNIIIISALALAHGGFEHVQGTVVKVENNVMTVKTTSGNQTVKLNAKTAITRNAKAAPAADLKAGTRVVVEIEEGDKDRIAHTVKLGAVGAK